MNFNKIIERASFWGIVLFVAILSLATHPLISSGLDSLHYLPNYGRLAIYAILMIVVLHGIFYQIEAEQIPSLEQIITFYLKLCAVIALVQFGAWRGDVSFLEFLTVFGKACFTISLLVFVVTLVGEAIAVVLKKASLLLYRYHASE